MTVSSTQSQDGYYAAVPTELKQCRNWVGWKLESKADNKPTKIPYSAKGILASSTDSRTWRTFEDVMRIPPSDCMGAGFVFDGNGIVGIDLDHCLDSEGNICDKFKPIVDALQTYTEVSPSGTGLHLFIRCCEKPYPQGRKKDDIEVYSEGRYFTVTGVKWRDDTPCDIREYDAETIRKLCKPFLGELPGLKPATPSSSSLSDYDIISIIQHSGNSSKFERLMRGSTSDYSGDASSADMALASILAFYTTDENQIERIMRGSGLRREKWDKHKTYLVDMTIRKAISMCTEHYESRETGSAEHGALVISGMLPKQSTGVVEYEPGAPRFDRKRDEPFDVSILPEDNLIRMFVEYACEIQDAYPEFHIANILALLSYVVPAKMEMSYGDTWNNVWFLVLGKAGQSGKSTTQGLITEIYYRMEDMNKPTMLPNKVTPERLTQLMAERDTRLWMVDEASGFMKNMKRDYASENTEVILKIYSHTEISKSTVAQKNASGQIISGGDIRCENPHVGACWYTTPEMFSKHASRDLFDNGFYMRPMFLLPNRAKGVREDRERTDDDRKAFDGIIRCISELGSAAAAVNPSTTGRHIRFRDSKKISQWKYAIRTVMAENTELTSTQGGGQTRSFEHVRKLAMLITIASGGFMSELMKDADRERARKKRVDDANIQNPEAGVTYTPLEYKYDIPDWAATIAIEWGEMFYNNYERAVLLAYSNNGGAIETILKILEDANGGWVPKLKLQDAVKKYGRQWDEIANALISEGEIEGVPRKQLGRGAPRTEYRLKPNG